MSCAKAKLLIKFESTRVNLISALTDKSQYFEKTCEQIVNVYEKSNFTYEELAIAWKQNYELLECMMVTLDNVSEFLNDIKRYRNQCSVLEESRFNIMVTMLSEWSHIINTSLMSISQGILIDTLKYKKLSNNIDTSVSHLCILDDIFTHHTKLKYKHILYTSLGTYKRFFRDMLSLLENNMQQYLSMGANIFCDSLCISRTNSFCAPT